MEVTDPLAFLGIATLVLLIYAFFIVGPATHGLSTTERERVVKLGFRGLNGRVPGWPDELVHLAIALFAQVVAIYAILAPERIAGQTGALIAAVEIALAVAWTLWVWRWSRHTVAARVSGVAKK
jgi:hypothetical protein